MTAPTADPTPAPAEEKRTKKSKAKESPTKKGTKKRAKKKLKVRASDQGAGGVVVGEGVKSQMMRVDPELGEYIRLEAKRLTKETGKYHNATDASRSLFAHLKHKAVKLAPWHDGKK